MFQRLQQKVAAVLRRHAPVRSHATNAAGPVVHASRLAKTQQGADATFDPTQPSAAVQHPSPLIRTPLSETRNPTDHAALLHRLAAYVPPLNAVARRPVAERLVRAVEDATRELTAETALALSKFEHHEAVVQQASARAVPSPTQSAEEIALRPQLERLTLFAKICSSDTPYQTLLERVPRSRLNRLSRDNPGLLRYQETFAPWRQAAGKVWTTKGQRQRVRSANQTAQEVARDQVYSALSFISRRLEARLDRLRKPELRPDKSLREYLHARRPSAPTEKAHLTASIAAHESAEAELPALTRLSETLEFLAAEHPDVEVRMGRLRSTFSDYERAATAWRQALTDPREANAPVWVLKEQLDVLKGRIASLFEERNVVGMPIVHLEEQSSVTRELLEAIQRFNQTVRDAESQVGSPLGSFSGYYLGPIQEAERISAGSILTHGGPTEWIYEVLARGELNSVIEQERRHGSSHRAFRNESVLDREKHDICFNIDGIYGKFSSNEARVRGGACIRADVVLLFSENQLLAGKQFVDLDGRHVFAESYGGDGSHSPGLSVDLKTTPFMLLVTADERDRLVRFLLQDSFLSAQLEPLEPDALQDWLDRHLVVTSSLDEFRITPAFKTRFLDATGWKLQRGYVELTDTVAQFKVDCERTKRFLPLLPEERTVEAASSTVDA